jgi:Zn-dependent membrane protease YugP
LVISTILWIVSGVLIHSLWGVILCRQGVGHIRGGLTECHELKIIEIIAWVLAGLSVIATIPVLMDASKRKKQQAERKTETSG